MLELGEPQSREELAEALDKVHAEVSGCFSEIGEDGFFQRPEEGVWSPAENLLHLVKSTKAVASALGYPKIVLAVLFGGAKASRSFPQVRDAYLDRLARGGRAGGPYLPQIETPADGAAATEARARLLGTWPRQAAALQGALRGWSEKQLDRRRLPHPLLGKLTVREMLFFTLYHDLHHVESVRKRRAQFLQATP